ncbi:hypothetical protein [Hymenobacter perfusus]|uniref:hypothetical protein n=1 Tax=Hymenobacter perfusus TaxID=1236770 RepID=UPI00147696D9|nr:hypothetical protein [Hymenobacter perfusus]
MNYLNMLLLSIRCCFLLDNNDYLLDKLCYSVDKIEFMHNDDYPKNSGVYILYLRRGNYKYRIFSEVEDKRNKKCIKVGRCYKFSLQDYYVQDRRFPIDLELAQSDAIVINGNRINRKEGEYTSVFYDENLQGLCFKQD